MKTSLIVVAVALMVVGCAVPTDIDVEFNEVFSLKVGQQAVLPDGNMILFEQVWEDSRCPEDAACVWEGNAVVGLEFLRDGARPQPFRLNTHEPFGNEVVIQGYTISLYNLNPVPHTQKTINPEDYVVELRVTR